MKYYIPKILGNVRRYGILNCSCYIPKTQRVLTATTNGIAFTSSLYLFHYSILFILSQSYYTCLYIIHLYAKIATCNLIFVIKIDIRYLCVGYVLVWGTFVERQKNKNKNQSAANNKEKRHIKSVQLEKNSIMVILYHNGYLIFSDIRAVQNIDIRYTIYHLRLKIYSVCHC